MKKEEGCPVTVASKPGFLKPSTANLKHNKIVRGWEFRLVNLLIGLNVIWLALLRYKNPWKTFSVASKVVNTRKDFKTTHPKIVKEANKYFMTLHTPGWPSQAFNRSIKHALNLLSQSSQLSLFSLVFAITHKCGFQCEHCVEWEELNRKDNLSGKDLVDIINRFRQLGISQVHLSGGEPLNRLQDILLMLDSVPRGIDFWVYTNGYSLSANKAAELKKHGLKGVIISLDHFDPQKHDQFRGIQGSFQNALQSARNATDNGLLLAFSCCATNEFISMTNLISFASLCRDAGASFIQFLEPEAVGHYQHRQVTLKKEKRELLEQVFEILNFDDSYSAYPIVSYPALIKRQHGCPGSGLHYLYVDADGYVQACPFCRNKLFHALSADLEKNIRSLREAGCPLIAWPNSLPGPDKPGVSKALVV